jgi:hypothetical protein
MSDRSSAGDYAMGLELQLEELVEQRARAETQHRDTDAAELAAQIAELQSQLADVADLAAAENVAPGMTPVIHDADKLGIDEEPT